MEPSETEQPPKKQTSFLGELKDRKVFRVAGTYAVVSWLIIQVASATFTDFGIPIWAFRFVVMMVLLGFPVAVILTWAFELTPEGVKRSGGVRRDKSAPEEPGLNRKRNWYAIGMAATLPTLIFGALAIFFYFSRSDSAPASGNPAAISAERPYVIGTLAVLPFTIISDEPGIGVIAEGLHEEMLTILSGMNPLDVISRTSTLRFGDFSASIPEIGKSLNADFVVEGSIQSIGQKLRLTLQLIEAATDNHIWAKSFDRDPDDAEDLIRFQKEVAFELSIRTYQALESTYPPTGRAKEIRDARLVELEEKLVADYARFWADHRSADWADQWRSIRQTIDEIVRIDPDHLDAYDKLAGLSYASVDTGLQKRYDPDWRKELYLILKQAYAVNPNGFDVNKQFGRYYVDYENRPGMAIPYSRKAIRSEKELRGEVEVYTYLPLLDALYETGQYAAALDVVEEAKEEGLTTFTGPSMFWPHAYLVNKRNEDAIAFLDEQIQKAKEGKAELLSEPKYLIFFYGFFKARILTSWTADQSHLFDYIEQNKGNEIMPVLMRAYSAYHHGDYQEALEFMSRIQQNTFISEPYLAELRGWIYLKSGNEAMARSYFKGFLKEMSDSPRARWMQQFRPDWHAAEVSYAQACLGNREEALSWAEIALEKTDPLRNFEDYFDSLFKVAITFALVDEPDRATRLIDQILSSPSGYSTGYVLTTDPNLKSLFAYPAFQAVIRKHADQLKDPAILEQLFGED